MSDRFCPNCGAQAGHQDADCPDCEFPLKLTVVAAGDDIRLSSGQKKAWTRLSQFLQRSGVRVETHRGSDWNSRQAWLLLPGLGAFLFLISILFGGEIARAIWGRPQVPLQVVDLNRPATVADETGAAGDGAVSDVDTSLLEQALRTTDEQRQLSEDLDFDPSEYVDRPAVSESAVLVSAGQAFLSVRVKDRIRRGTLLTDRHFLIESETLIGAYRNEIQNVRESGSLTQRTVFIVPEVGVPGGDRSRSEIVDESARLGVTLMSAPLNASVPFEIEYDIDLSVGDEVWVSYLEGRQVKVGKHRIIDAWENSRDIRFWRVDGEYGPENTGAPVFNREGKLAGMFFNKDGDPSVLSLLRLRENAPVLFKEVK